MRLPMLAVGSMVALGVATAAAQTPPAHNVTLALDDAPIPPQSFDACHRIDGMTPMSLVTYAEIRPGARATKKKVASRLMPPPRLEAAATGHVLDSADGPAIGARVRVGYPELEGHGFLDGLVRGNVMTGVDGSFAITGLVPDTPITVWAELDGKTSDAVTITVGPGMALSDVALQLQP